MQYKRVVEQLAINKQRREDGDLIAIPWSLPRLSQVLPGIEQGRYYLVSASPKAGKCLGKDTKVRMYNGKLKKVQDVKIGDKLLNPFGEPNVVISTDSGIDKLYKVYQNTGMDYIVNSNHILSLKCNSNILKYKKGEYVNLPIEDYIKIATTTKYQLKGYRKDLSTTSLNIKEIGEGEYYGFTLSGNHLFCLEDYTVSHNSQMCDYLFIFQPTEWLLKNPKTDVSLKIFYFSLEMSTDSKLMAAICHRLYTHYNIAISPQKLSSVFEEYVLESDILDIIKSDEFQSWLHYYNSIITYYDQYRSPYQIFKTVKSYAEHPDNGEYTYKTIQWQLDDGTYVPRKVRDRYIPKRPNEYVLVVLDHIGLVQPSADQTLHQAISKYSNEYCLEMRDKWNYIPVIVQQQTADSSKAQFTQRGDTIVDKIKPSSEGLADNKYTARDVDLMLSLFYPYKYNIQNYEDIDLSRLGDNHRELMINLNRNGISNASLQLFFLGTSSYFEEFPKKLNEFDYQKYEQIINKTK